MKGAYYRADVTDSISVLSINTMYWNVKDKTENDGGVPEEQFEWLEQQLSNDDGRKFLITYHIYPGSKHTSHYKTMIFPKYNERYIRLINQYSDRVIMEIGAHDHYGDLRYHDKDISDVDFNDKVKVSKLVQKARKEASPAENKEFFRNIFITPAVSPIKTNNPGVTLLEVDDLTLEPQNLISHFFQLNKYNEDSSVDEFHIVNYQDDFGVTDLSPYGIHSLKSALEDDKDSCLAYLVQKVGYTMEDQDLPLKNIYEDDLNIISSKKHHTEKFICQMHKSLSSNEFHQCYDDTKSLLEESEVTME